MCSFTKKACKFAIKRNAKIFCWSSQKNRWPSAKYLSQTPFFRFRLRASPVVESFLLKLKTTTTCFEHDIFHNNLKDNIKTNLFLQILQVATKIGIYHRLFCGDNFTSKNFNKLSLVESLLIYDGTIVYSPKLYQIPSKMISWGRFEIIAPKILGICQKSVCGGVPIRVAQIKSTAYYRTALQMHSGSAQKGKYILKFWKFQKHLCKTVPFFLTLQPCSPEFLNSAITGSKKNVSFEYSEIVGSLPEKGLKQCHLIN